MGIVNRNKKSIVGKKTEPAIVFHKVESLEEDTWYDAEVKSLKAKGENVFLIVKPFRYTKEGRAYFSTATAMLEQYYEKGTLTSKFIYSLKKVADAREYEGEVISIKVVFNEGEDGKVYNNISDIRPSLHTNPSKVKKSSLSEPEPEEDFDEEEPADEDFEEDFETETDLYEDEDEE